MNDGGLYVVEVTTNAGDVLVGPFSKDEAIAYAGRLGRILPLFDPVPTARELIEAGSSEKVGELLLG